MAKRRFSRMDEAKLSKRATLFLQLQSFICKMSPGQIKYGLRVKQITTILLLSCFMLFHYGRVVSYWECRLSNTFKATNEKCDCGQLINDVMDQSDSNPAPVQHKHLHLDDSFYPAFTESSKETHCLLKVNGGAELPVYINLNLASRLERPPQLS